VGLLALSILLSGCSKRSPEERAMTPQGSLEAMSLSEDFRVELFAAEPDVMSPVEMAFDENGRVFVAEMLDYPSDPPPGKPARSRIRLLENSNGDGKTWRAAVFADNVLAVSGFMPWKGGLIVTAAPDILFLKDTDGDGRADLREVLYTGFPLVNQEARITNPRLGVDNWIYCSNTGSDGRITSPRHAEMAPVLVRGADFRFDPISGAAEPASGAAQFGSTLDDFGHRFITQNTTHIRHVVVPMKYLTRAPLLEVRAVAQDISDHGKPSGPMFPLTGPQEWRKQRSALRQHRHNENKRNFIEQVSGWFTAASGGTLYDGDNFPAEYAGSVFTGDVSGNLVHRDIVKPQGATFSASRAKEKVEFLASTDVWFRPCNFANAPDGNLYFTDIYRQVIETPESIPEELRKKIDFYNGDTLGRIYRIVPNHPRRQGDLKPNLGKAGSAELAKLLESSNGWHRQTAHRLLLERQDRSAIPHLKAVAERGTSPEARVHALWLLQAHGALDPAEVARAMKDADSRVRVQALQLSERHLKGAPSLAGILTLLAADPDPQVRFQAALTLGEWKDRRALATLAQLAHTDSADPWFRVAILSSVADEASPFFRMLLAKGETWADPQLLIEASAIIGARQNPSELVDWLTALPTLKQPEQHLAGLTRGLRLVGARNLRVPGADRSLARFLSSGSEPVQRAAWEAARHFELSSLIERARRDALSGELAPDLRVRAVRALRGGRYDSVAPVLEKVIQSHPPQEVESAAVDALAAFDEPSAGRVILDHWREYSPVARQHAVSALLATRDRIPMLLKAVEAGLVERSALDASARSHLYDDSDPAIVASARRLLESSNSDRAKAIASYQDAAKLAGDLARGKKLFEENCARCHEPRRQYGRIGPDLSGINNKTKEELIASILNPSYAIEPRFVNYIITTTDGRMHDGIIANETAWAITLRGGAEEDETILRKNISSVRASSVSLMPEELEKGLGKQGLADVITYLRGGL
jgi:putative membrane-bound dehydrogenase-like protein